MYKYDFGLSFAGEDRNQVEKLVKILANEAVKVFYDRDKEAELWGSDLYQNFQKIYRDECRFFVPFISKDYLTKSWPRHELQQAQARDFKSDIEYILPLRLDDSILPGLNETTGYVDLRHTTIERVAELCLEKLVNDSGTRQLYLFLREKNPQSINLLAQKTSSLCIRVSLSDVPELNRILQNVGNNICTGRDHHNTILNGGYGSGIPSTVPEPHTNFTLTFTENFFNAVDLEEDRI